MEKVISLQQKLSLYFGTLNIESTLVPDIITQNLNPVFKIRPYQQKAFQFFLNYWEKSFEGKPRQNHQLLFHMATGSGKTLMMAGLILYLYEKGYRNFLFMVNNSNIVNKTRDNFLNALSKKYLFNDSLQHKDKHFSIHATDSFQSTSPNDVNIVFTTIQGLHSLLNNPHENALTYDDFENEKMVIISDEAHHINVDTKKGKPSQDELFESITWESTVQRIIEAHTDNVLLEFTATIDFADQNIAEKYQPRLVFDYTLREFRQDGYSKEVKVLQADLSPMERALQAVLLSQYRRKIFDKNRISMKPVILLKSKTIKESKDFFEEFKNRIHHLKEKDIADILEKNQESPYLRLMLSYFKTHKISFENLATELKNDFSEDKLIEVNSKEESEHKQIALNSLEAPNNEYRAIFAVDKLNEGWDVLNLFDIVRLYNTRDAQGVKVGKTTMSEAQLIGRGARYCPFKLSPEQPADQRKFDEDITNEMRICEELIYHSAYNPKYIQELNTALREIGAIAKETKECVMKLKESFKNTAFYKSGFLFLNERKESDGKDKFGLNGHLIQKLYQVKLLTGTSQTSLVFDETNPLQSNPSIQTKHTDYELLNFGLPVLHKAIQRLDFFEFENLKKYCANLKSIHQFLTADEYLGKIKVEVSGNVDSVSALSAENKLYIALKILEEIAVGIASDKFEYEGTKEFKPRMIKEVIFDKTLNISNDIGDDQEWGKSMNDHETSIHLDLTQRDWYVFNDCYGTSEEKLLIKYIEKQYEQLKKSYSDVYLIRNERHFKIFAFDDGKPLEPDFILYLIGNEQADTMYYQVFIEPKGGHLLKADAWKESFLLRLQKESKIDQLWKDKKYAVWGLPFYNSQHEVDFNKAFSDDFLNK